MSLETMPQYSTDVDNFSIPEPLEEEFGPVQHGPMTTAINGLEAPWVDYPDSDTDYLRGLDGLEEAKTTWHVPALLGVMVGALGIWWWSSRKSGYDW